MQERESEWGGSLMRAAAALGLLLASSAAFAQLSCNPAAPRTDPGTGFVAFGEREQLLARGGNAGPAWEWALGTDTDVEGQNVKASHDWVSGKSYSWTLTYAGTAATVQLRDGATLLFTRSFSAGMDRGNSLHFQVGTNPSIGASTTIAATVTSLNGNPVSGAISQSGNNQDSSQSLYFFFPPLVEGISAQGTVSLTYASLPTGSRVDFKVRAGTIACTSTNTAPTVSLTSPVSGEGFQAPASVLTVAAAAQDADGSIAQVEFFANGILIGGATASPYSIQWVNVVAGDYVLTARATDNLGAQTTSAAINISVRVPQLFFVHTDHLNTPRLIANQAGQPVWSWANDDPFGANLPNEDPSGLGIFTCNLRLPGQYFDKETNLHYNYFRDYDPGISRYVQSDPIGLAGGINPYLYVIDPLTQIDPEGLMGRAAGPGKSAPGPIRFGGGAAGLNKPEAPVPYCDGRWMRVGKFRRSAVPGLYMIFGQVPPCWCDWNCRSCPGGSDITANPPIATNTTKGFVFFSGTAGSETDPERGDACLCSRPGPEKGCSGC